MKSIESSAKTIEDAVTQGLEQLGVSLGDVKIDILDEGSKGLFGLIGGKPARVRLTMKEGKDETDLISSLSLDSVEKKDTAKAAKPSVKEKAETAKKQVREKTKPAAKTDAPTKPVAEEKQTPATAQAETTKVETVLCDPTTAAGKAQQFLLDVTRLMGVDVSVNARVDDEGNVRVDMMGDTLGILIGRRGETLDALQYLTSLFVNRGQDDYTRVTLDTENYRAKREEALTRLANRMANRAVKTGRKVVLEPMNPYERRILHSALQSSDTVTTHSEGEEPNRHVVITLK